MTRTCFRDVSEITGAPEMLGGRVKTLHPAVHAGKWINCITSLRLHASKKVGVQDLIIVDKFSTRILKGVLQPRSTQGLSC